MAVISDPVVRNIVVLPGVFAPSLVALALTARSEGKEGVRRLLGSIFRGPVAARWYVFAATYTAAIKLSAALLHRAITGEWPLFGQIPWYVLVGATLLSTPVQAGEEIGWRGYALPGLARRMGLAKASVLLGIVWACWHLPFFFMPGTDTSGQSFPLYLAQVTAYSAAAAFLFWRAGGCLLPVMLLHAAVNNTKDIVPSAEPGATNPLAWSHSLVAWLTVALLWICAAYFLARMRGVRTIAPEVGPA
ncbi:MAG TPA: type II CAAX endopeptidase family protein [Thermoanaerobaculia bacterium]|nr:type II CAAX endopeptidase family protein [Thermoanaerobaculia bacterium]